MERNAKRAAERGNMLNGCSGISSLCAEIRSNLCGPFAKLFGQQFDIIYGTPRQSNARDSPSTFTLGDAPHPPLTLAQNGGVIAALAMMPVSVFCPFTVPVVP